jgi:thiosulfate/3-mercaptopyruvate sulfurtransferase
MRKASILILILCALGSISYSDINGLVHAPTIYLEKTPPQLPKKPKKQEIILLDARPAFDYAMGHLPHAVSIRWQDYSQTQEPHKGALDPDSGLLSRKLRYLGVGPERSVIVLGSGEKGLGDEGRIAWMLSYLGVKNVKVQNVKNVPGRKTTENGIQPIGENESAPPWNPILVSSLRIRKADVEKVRKEKPQNQVLIDVRGPAEFEAKHIDGAINIPWLLFLNEKGEPKNSSEVKELLTGNKVDSSKTLVFYSKDGVTSGYVTFVSYLANLDAANYDGSFDEWSN